MKFIVAACMAAAASALTGANGLADYLLFDQISHSTHGSKFLPLSVLTGNNPFGTNAELTNLWAMNEFAGGSHSDFSDLAALSTFGGVTGTDLTDAWTLQQLHNGHTGHGYSDASLAGAVAGSALASAIGIDSTVGAIAGGHRAAHYGMSRPDRYAIGGAALASAAGVDPLTGALLGGHRGRYGRHHMEAGLAGAIAGGALATAFGVDPTLGAIAGGHRAHYDPHTLSHDEVGAIGGAALATAAGVDPIAGALLGAHTGGHRAHYDHAPVYAPRHGYRSFTHAPVRR